MKRKIAILLATTMTLSAVPTFAARTKAPALNGSKSTVVTGESISKLSGYDDITAVPADKDAALAYRNALRQREAVIKLNLENAGDEDITANTSKFTIQLENGDFGVAAGSVDPQEYAYRNVVINADGTVSVFYVKDGNLYKKTGTTEEKIDAGDISTVLAKIVPATPALDNVNDVTTALTHIPYSIKIVDETTAEVTFLTNITNTDITRKLHHSVTYFEEDSANKGTVKEGKEEAYFAIPLGAVKSTGGEELKVTIDKRVGNVSTNGQITIASVISGGSNTKVDTSRIKKQTFESSMTPSNIVVNELVNSSFGSSQITLRLSSGFKFDTSTAGKAKFKVTDYNGGSIKLKENSVVFSDDGTRVSFNLENYSSSKKEAIEIALPNVEPISEDKGYGEVSITISGNDISTETVVIGERQKTGFKLEAKTEVPTITKGRYAGLNSNLNSKGNTTADVEFSEAVAGSLYEGRSLDFTVPSGVKIVDAKLVSSSGITLTNGNDAFSIINDGTTLRLARGNFKAPTNNTAGKFRLRLQLSVDAAFSGEEIKLSATGAGISETLETVVAKVQDPFTITATPKNINIGYQDYAVNDIVIAETQPGMFIEGGNLNLSIEAPYGTDQMGFTDATVNVTGGNLEIKPSSGTSYLSKTSNSNNSIAINIKTQSTKEPATITISNVKIGTTRSVPYGAYNLKIDGSAVLNNNILKSNTELNGNVSQSVINNISLDIKPTATSEKDKAIEIAKRINAENGSYLVKGYVNVVTATDTIDKEMKVTIGSTAAMIDGKEVTMDVAPYIQANGNTMVPLRFVTVALAGGDATSVEAAQNSDKISWDAASKTVTIFYGAGINQKIIQFRVGSTNMIVDGNTIPMENGATAEIKNGRTFVPFRSLGQALGVPVSWDATTKTAIFNQK